MKIYDKYNTQSIPCENKAWFNHGTIYKPIINHG